MTSENNGILPINLVNRNLSHELLVEKTVEEIKKHKYINPLYDAGFKAFLSDEHTLLSFLNGVFQTDERNRIESVVIKNTEINIIFLAVKQFRLDIRATTSNGLCFNVEMQKARPDYFVDRVLLQHSAFVLQSKYEWDQINFGQKKIKYIMYEFTKTFEDLKNDEDRWLYLLKHAGSAENLPDFNDDVIAKAINRLLVNKASDKLLKEQADDMVFTEEQLDRMALARVRARAIVLAEGEQKKAREMARALKTMDVPIEKIVAASGLTQAEVEAL